MRRLVLIFVLLALVAPVAPAAAATGTAERQLDWLVEISQRPPVSEAEQRQHLATSFIEGVGGPDAFNEVLESVGPLTTARTLLATPGRVQAVADDRVLVDLGVDAAGLVDELWFRPYAPTPASWSELDSRLRTLAPRVSFAASVLDDRCRPVHEVAADTPRPLGSSFKLYVLGALERRTTDWSAKLAIRDAWKSLPSGVLQDRPAGTELTLQQYADLMISISDNTATDHLVHHLGRDTVRRQFTAFGNSVPKLAEPMLTTRELFTLKGFRYPKLADTYLSLPRQLRRTMLPALAAVPRTAIQPWTGPRDLDGIEWFGSANDMCRAFAGLAGQRSPRVARALSTEDGGIGLDRAEYPTVWFKGGSEPGLLVLNHLARTADGRTAVATVMLVNPDTPIPPGATTEALALVRGGIELATR